jgi:hypothetical protein
VSRVAIKQRTKKRQDFFDNIILTLPFRFNLQRIKLQLLSGRATAPEAARFESYSFPYSNTCAVSRLYHADSESVNAKEGFARYLKQFAEKLSDACAIQIDARACGGIRFDS